MPRLASLSFDLLETFVKLVENDGDALATSRELQINQPSMSKRLRYLQLSSPVLKRPWLVREGKRWKLTEEGAKALPAVRELMDRYEKLTEFNEPRGPDLRLGCGREAVVGFVREAVREFTAEMKRNRKEIRLHISTMRGAARIEGVANGALDMALVTHDEASIHSLARRTLHVDSIARHRLALVAHVRSPWARALKRLPERKTPPAALTRFPLILPEPDAGIRKDLDETLRRQGLLGQLQIRLEVGGWAAILAYVADRQGVGIVSEAAVRDPKSLIVRHLDPEHFPPTELRLICRPGFSPHQDKALSADGLQLYEALRRAAK